MKIRTWNNLIKEGLYNVFRNRVMSLASISAIMAALFVLGLVLVAVFNINHIMSNLGSKVEVTLFLKKEAVYNDIQSIENQIKGWQGVREVEFISKNQALDNMKEELGSRMEGYTSENNPLPDSFIVRVTNPEDVSAIVRRMESLPLAERVNYSQTVVDVLERISSATRLIGLVVVILLGAIAAIIINNTIKISVYSRRKEINIMKYIGATDSYIRWPFIIEGFTLGMAGALLSLGLLSGIYHFIIIRTGAGVAEQNFLSIFQLVPLGAFVRELLIVFLTVGGAVGVFASAVSIRKHLKV